MKTLRLLGLLLTASVLMLLAACSDSDNNDGTTDPDPETGIIGDGSIDGSYEITTNVVFKKGTYQLKGWVYVTKGGSVTFEPGCIIKGEKETMAALIIEPGSKLSLIHI